MVNKAVRFCVFRVVLPFALAAAVICRQNVLSLIYLLLLLVAPVVSLPSQKSMASHTGRYVKALLATSIGATIAQVIFQVVLLSLPPYGHFLDFYTDLEVLFRIIGFQRYDAVDPLQAARLIGPEILMLIVSVIVYVVSTNVSTSNPRATSSTKMGSEHHDDGTNTHEHIKSDEEDDDVVCEDSQRSSSKRLKRKAFNILGVLGDVLAMVLLASAGIIRPSITSAVYYLTFLAVATWVSCFKKLRKKYAILRVFISIYTAIHLVVLYVYQIPIVQHFLPPDSLYARLFGLTAMVKTEDHDPRDIVFLPLEWASYVNPAILLALYWILVLETKLWMRSPNISYGNVYESTPLLSADGTGRHYSTVEALHGPSLRDGNVDRIEIDPHGSVILSNADTGFPNSEDIHRLPVSKLRQLMSPLTSIFLLITRQSYIATLIVMMAWSITYHSWLTFVLLLWSCILWMMPNSRNACLRSSPALVIYAEALLIIQYIYGLSLTDKELPQSIEEVNLRQIGFVKYPDLPCLPLAVKVLYTLMFWITLRQYMEERYNDKNINLMDGVMLEPVNMVCSTTRAGTPNIDAQRPKSMQESPFMKQLGSVVLRFLTTYWIWVVACMLMVISLQGEKVVIYRVMYMALFLFFILIFQLSYRWWRKIMYVFWLTVIFYSMFVLILIYTYQFENFPYYWSTYLNISKKLQKDIGLEVYDTGQLFLKLLPPTFFVVITIIQLHYFHKDFLQISDIDHGSPNNSQDDPEVKGHSSGEHRDVGKFTSESRSETKETNVEDIEPIILSDESEEIKGAEANKLCSETNPVVIGIPPTPTDNEQPHFTMDEIDEQNKNEEDEKNWKEIVLNYMKRGAKHAVKIFDIVSEFVWRFLEIHMNKIVMFAALMLALYDVCAVHVIFVLLVTIALPFRFLQIFVSHCCAVWSSVLLISKMIYQIDYVEEVWTVNCTDVEYANQSLPHPYPFNDTVNNAQWMGYYKVENLPNYLKGYIGIILVLSIQAVVRVRQRYHRNQFNIPEPKTGIIFTDITRSDADNGLIEALKYLVNFTFYKFGVEINFMTMVAVIGIRLDILSVAYALWLGALFLLRRSTLDRIWPFYVAFLSILLPIQYSMCVGMPPGFCIEYPWSDPRMDKELREWMYLPDFIKPLPAYKLAVDFFQLLFACCQLFVFKIEAAANAESYEGGSNKELAYIGFNEPDENPICDFVTYTKSYLDLVKVIIFSLFYWVTLAVIFLAGTNRVSLFAMGYVVGCFLFLWNGQDFYLKPLKTILKLWNTLLAYNIFVIFTKSLLQMVGCVFVEQMLGRFCWAIQLFGIACIKKFESQTLVNKSTSECTVPEDEAGLLWDGICLGFMLMQRRLFCSYYFHHLVTEMHAQTKLASRGAELINQLLMKEVNEQQAEEREVMEKIKKKMDRIRANQQKIRGKEYSEHQDHFKTIRSGDYFMFEDNSDDEDLAELDQEKKSDEKDDDVRGMSVSKLLSSAMKSDIKQAVSEAKQSKEGPSPDGMLYRQTSSEVSSRPPVSRTVSAVSGASSLPIGMSVSRQASLRSQGYNDTDRTPAFPLLHTADDKGYDSFGAGEDDSRSPPLPDLDNVLQVVPAQEEDIDTEEEEGLSRKIINWLKFAWAFIEGLMVSATTRLNVISKDYRYVARCLGKEKKILKEKGMVSAQSLKGDFDSLQLSPSPHMQPLIKAREEPLEIRVEKASEDQNGGSVECLDTPEELEREFEKDQHVAVRLVVAFWFALVSRSEIVCYMMIVFNQIKSASLLSLPLPCMVFLWGTFSLPRPTKTFWITIITYTEAVVVIKYLFQFEFFPWNEGPKLNPPFWPPRIIGIEKKEQYAIYDLALLMVIFFHRFILKSLGLWKDEESDSSQVQKESVEEDNSNSNSTDKTLKEKSEEITRSSFSGDLKEECDFEEEEQELEGIGLWSAKDCILNYTQPFKVFFHNLFYPPYRVTVDVYAFMFLCDFATFLILVFGYWAFGPGGGDGGVTSYFEENQVPVPFLVMLIAQFALIIIDRALFLRKFILGKVIFQVAMVFIVHIWMFFVLPAVSEKDFNSSLPPQLWYLVKCVYLLLSSYQIRSGYPTRILGNFVTKKYNYVNMFLFRGFMAVPFLFELRALMDWIWTETSMSLSSWLKMEDIFANIFILKCQRRAEAEYPTPRGEARKPLTKYGIGGSFLFIIIFIIWFPLVLFALGNTVGVPNPPYDVTIEITFGGYQPVFKMSAQHGSLKPFSKKQYDDVVYWYGRQRDALAFFQNYDEHDIVVAELTGNSTAVWGISPPSQQQLIQDLISNNSMTLKFAWYVTRATTNPDILSTVTDERPLKLQPNDPIRLKFARMLNGTESQNPILVPQFFPKFIRAPRRGKAVPVKQLLKDRRDNINFSNLTMSLRTGDFLNFTIGQEWWEVREACENSYFWQSPIQSDCNYLRIITVNDKAFPTTLSILSGYGIVGMYTTLVLLISRFVRGLFAGVSYHIMFDDMPYVDRVLQLCRDIYLVRESGELHLEEDLFAKLIFLYRSPETLIKWTRFPQRENNSP